MSEWKWSGMLGNTSHKFLPFLEKFQRKMLKIKKIVTALAFSYTIV